MNFKPERGKDETFEQYKQRRALSNQVAKWAARGTLFWNSAIDKTFRKKEWEAKK